MDRGTATALSALIASTTALVATLLAFLTLWWNRQERRAPLRQSLYEMRLRAALEVSEALRVVLVETLIPLAEMGPGKVAPRELDAAMMPLRGPTLAYIRLTRARAFLLSDSTNDALSAVVDGLLDGVESGDPERAIDLMNSAAARVVPSLREDIHWEPLTAAARDVAGMSQAQQHAKEVADLRRMSRLYRKRPEDRATD